MTTMNPYLASSIFKGNMFQFLKNFKSSMQNNINGRAAEDSKELFYTRLYTNSKSCRISILSGLLAAIISLCVSWEMTRIDAGVLV